MFTNGTVTVEDGIKGPEDYAPPRKASVTLFIEDAAEADLAEAASLASKYVDAMLGRPERVFGAPTAGAAKASKKPTPPAAAGGTPAVAPSPPDTSASPPAEGATPASPSSGDDDGWDTPPTEAKPVEISDADLTSACAKANTGEAVRDQIKATIAKFCPLGVVAKTALIPQEKRADFLAALALVKAA